MSTQFSPGTGPYNYPQITISTPLTPPPQIFTNTATLLEANILGVLLFRNGLLQTEGTDYTRERSRIEFTSPPAAGDVLTARVFPLGKSLGGPTQDRNIAPWSIAVTGALDGVSLSYQIQSGPTISGNCNGENNVFTWGVVLRRVQLFRNGILQTIGVDYSSGPTVAVFLPASIPQAGDILAIYGWG